MHGVVVDQDIWSRMTWPPLWWLPRRNCVVSLTVTRLSAWGISTLHYTLHYTFLFCCLSKPVVQTLLVLPSMVQLGKTQNGKVQHRVWPIEIWDQVDQTPMTTKRALPTKTLSTMSDVYHVYHIINWDGYNRAWKQKFSWNIKKECFVKTSQMNS